LETKCPILGDVWSSFLYIFEVTDLSIWYTTYIFFFWWSRYVYLTFILDFDWIESKVTSSNGSREYLLVMVVNIICVHNVRIILRGGENEYRR